MTDKTQNNTATPSGKEYYSDSNGTGVVSSLVFIVVAIIIMVVASHFIN